MPFARLLASVRALLALPERLRGELRDVERALRTAEKSVQQAARRHEAEIDALRAEVETLRNELRERVLQYHLQLGRLSAAVDGSVDAPLGGRVPVSVVGAGFSRPENVGAVAGNGSDRPHSISVVRAGFSRPNDWLDLAACPACGVDERTIVCEWNKLVLLDTAPDGEAARYDYAVCHGCGILYATRRPVGDRYRHLVDNFEDVIDKDAKNPLLNPHPLTDADRDRYRRLISRGVFVSDHEKGEHLVGLLKDRLENAGHVDLLGSLLNPRGARVLEVRPRAGTILEGLRRLYNAEVYAMPIWESQQFILEELYQIPTTTLIDFDRFEIPFHEPFDLIVCNHMFNHAVRLDVFLAAVRGALRPGGHLYLYNEIDDSEFLDGGQSMIATMNPLHLQACNGRSLVRAVGAAGFTPVFLNGRQKRNFCLMRKTDEPTRTRISARRLENRIAAYQLARDRAVLRAPERVRSRFAQVWPATVERAVASGIARFDDKGTLRLVKESALPA